MLAFRYKAMDGDGKMIRGVLEAASDTDLEMKLRAMGMELISLQENKSMLPSIGRAKKIARRDLITFCFHLEQQVKAGVPLIEGLKDLRDSVDNRTLQEVTAALVEKIESGSNLSSSMDEFPQTFDKVFVALIRAGERSGKMVEVLQSLTDTLKWQDELASQAKKALMYPLFVAVSVTGVVAALMIFLVPELIKFITSMNQELPIHTKLLIWFSDSLRFYGHYFLGVVIFVVAVVKTMSKQGGKFAQWLDAFKLRLWVVGPVMKKLMLSRFTHHFAILYSSGITVMECLKISEDIVGNRVLAKAISDAERHIGDGQSLSKGFEMTGLFPRLVLRMLKVGESTGALDTSLSNISYFYDRDVRDSLEKMQSMIGPAMTVILGTILSWVILSVFGPIYNSLTTVTM